MEISFNSTKNMNAELINGKDHLQGSIVSEYANHKVTSFKAYIGRLSYGSSLADFAVSLVKYHKSDSICVKSIAPVTANKSNLYKINTPTLQHGMNMIKGFFTSNKYRDYVISHSKRAKLIAKKRKLSREISKIDKELD